MLGSKVRLVGLATLLAAGAVQVADAHGPTRKKVEESITINAAPDKVWKVIGNFDDVSWMSEVKSSSNNGKGNLIDASNDDNEPSQRTLTLATGGPVQEGLYKFDAAEHTYSYRIDKVSIKVLPVNDFSSTISVEPADGGKSSKVVWKAAFYRGYMNNDPPPNLDDAASMAAVDKYFKANLEGLKKKLEATG